MGKKIISFENGITLSNDLGAKLEIYEKDGLASVHSISRIRLPVVVLKLSFTKIPTTPGVSIRLPAM